MPALNAIRLVLLLTTLCGSLVIIGIDAHYAHLYHDTFPTWPLSDWLVLNLVTACLTSFVVGTSLIIDRLRPGAITSLVMIELAWIGLLWPLWLSTAAFNITMQPWWGYAKAVRVFSFVNWFTLFGWWDILLTSSVRAASNGVSGVWRTPGREHLGHSTNATSPHGRPPTTTCPTVPVPNYGGPAPGQLQPGSCMPPAPQQPYWPQQGYGFPPLQEPYSIPQPQQGYGTPKPLQGYGTPPPQPIYGVPAPGSPPNASQG